MTEQSQLFDPEEFRPSEPLPAEKAAGRPRLRCAVRDQVVMHFEAVDDLIPAEHAARMVWSYVERLDLSPLLAEVKAVEGEVGRPLTDPQILLTLWLYATIEGIGSARGLAILCENHAAYKWICGGVSLNHHTLSDFRTAQTAFLDDLLTHSVATLVKANVVELKRVAHDGVRVRASAGQSSFRRRDTLQRLLEEAREQVQTLKAELDSDPSACRNRQQAARQRAAEDRQARVEQALAELAKIEAKKPAAEKETARASTTDPQSRRMKMACGGFRPAYNVQFATDLDTQVVVGVDLINVGSDKGQLRPMHDQLRRRYGRVPQEYLADGDFESGEDFEYLAAAGTQVYVPPRRRPAADEPVAARSTDSPVIRAWRERMASPEGQAIYRQRSKHECVNAHARNRNLQQFPVRGPTKAKTVALWQALAQNILCTWRLLPSHWTQIPT